MPSFSWTIAALEEAAAAAASASGEFRRVYRRIFANLLPAWLLGGDGELVFYSLGILKDAVGEKWRLALLSRYPSTCADDAVPLIARDRKLVQGISESLDDFRVRLQGWRQAHHVRGNARSLLQQLQHYIGPVRIRTVDRRGNWYTIGTDGTITSSQSLANWDWDALGAERWARFWVIVYSTGAEAPWTQSSGTIGGDSPTPGDAHETYGSTLTTAHAATIRQIIRDWQPDGVRCEWIIVSFDDALFDPAGTPEPDGFWGRWGKRSGGTTVPSRSSSALYFAGVDGGRRGDSP